MLFVAGFLASGINAFAGGGSLISFPVLVGLGIPDLKANATNAVSLWPGSLSSAVGFREYWRGLKPELRMLAPVTLVGSCLGALLLAATDQGIFRRVIPFLILGAVLLMLFQMRQPRLKSERREWPIWLGILLQFLLSVYGGYFGAGMGILMLALFSVAVEGDIHRHNALKNILALAINFASSGILIYKGLVMLVPALALMTGSIVGGWVSAHMSLKVDSRKLKWVVITYGLIMSTVFMVRAFSG